MHRPQKNCGKVKLSKDVHVRYIYKLKHPFFNNIDIITTLKISVFQTFSLAYRTLFTQDDNMDIH